MRQDKVVTRFAPSPTGFLHIGGARTALFNWLYAEANSGKMLLRIEDTDRKRSTDEAVSALLDGLQWLGIKWDGEPISQHKNAERHREVAEELLVRGKAYRCYATPEELEEMRETAKKNKSPTVYDRRWRNKGSEEAPDNKPFVIRLKAPMDGETVVDDIVQGKVTFPNKDLEDFVLLRSDGTPTYMLAVVVDDHDMGVTHIIRGDDHLTNAAKQTLIYSAMEWDIPTMAHIPLIHGQDGAKLSKRHGALGVEHYRDMGYLPDALQNYLLRLGWSHGDQEMFGLDELKKIFTLEAIGKSPARIDFDKMKNMNGQYIRMTDDDELAELATRQIQKSINEKKLNQIVSIMPEIKKRTQTLPDIIEGIRFILNDEEEIQKNAKAIIEDQDGEVVSILKNVSEVIETIDTWSVEEIEQVIRNFAENQNLKLGQVAQPVRAAITGQKTSISVFEVIHALDKEQVIRRIQAVL